MNKTQITKLVILGIGTGGIGLGIYFLNENAKKKAEEKQKRIEEEKIKKEEERQKRETEERLKREKAELEKYELKCHIEEATKDVIEPFDLLSLDYNLTADERSLLFNKMRDLHFIAVYQSDKIEEFDRKWKNYLNYVKAIKAGEKECKAIITEFLNRNKKAEEDEKRKYELRKKELETIELKKIELEKIEAQHKFEMEKQKNEYENQIKLKQEELKIVKANNEVTKLGIIGAVDAVKNITNKEN